MNDLQALVSDRMAELDLSYRRAAARSGGLVSHATLNSIASGRHSWRLDDRTVQGIARALDVDEDAVREACGQQQTAPATEFVLPARAARLSPKDRRAVMVMVDALLAAAEGSVRKRATDHDTTHVGDPAQPMPMRRATDAAQTM